MFWTQEELKELTGTGVVDKIGRKDAEEAFKEKLWPLIEGHPELFPVKDKDQTAFMNIFHRMGSLVMAYAFHDSIPGKDEDEDMDEDDDDEEEEEQLNVSMVPMADMLNHKTGFNNVRRPLELSAWTLSGL